MERTVPGLRQAISLLLASVWVLCFCNSSWGQSGTSSVHGTVLDPQKKVVSGATVSLTNSERNFLRTQKSNPKRGISVHGRSTGRVSHPGRSAWLQKTEH